jgi:hypothetical protein
MNTTTKFSPIHITLDKYNEFDTLYNVLENAIEQYETESTERHFLIDLINSLGEVYSFNEERNAGTEIYISDLDNNEEEYSAEGGPSDLFFAMRSIEERLSDIERELQAGIMEMPEDTGYPARQSKLDWHKMTLAWAQGQPLEFFDFNEPGWHDLPGGQEEWYGYDRDIAFRFKDEGMMSDYDQ